MVKKQGRDILREEKLGNNKEKIVSSTTSTILKYLMGSSNAQKKGPWIGRYICERYIGNNLGFPYATQKQKLKK